MGNNKLGKVEFKSESHKFRKFLSIVCFFLLLGGYGFLIGYNFYVSSATSQIRVVPQGFTKDFDQTEMKITLGGVLLIENDHWNSLSIKDFNLTIGLLDENHTKIDSTSYQETIPNHQNTTLNLLLEYRLNTSILDSIDLGDIYEMTPEDFQKIQDDLYKPKTIIFAIHVSFMYALYNIAVEIEIPYTFEVVP